MGLLNESDTKMQRFFSLRAYKSLFFYYEWWGPFSAKVTTGLVILYERYLHLCFRLCTKKDPVVLFKCERVFWKCQCIGDMLQFSKWLKFSGWIYTVWLFSTSHATSPLPFVRSPLLIHKWIDSWAYIYYQVVENCSCPCHFEIDYSG